MDIKTCQMRPKKSGTGVLNIDTKLLTMYITVPIMLHAVDVELQVAGDVLLAACKVGVISGASLCRLQVAIAGMCRQFPLGAFRDRLQASGCMDL